MKFYVIKWNWGGGSSYVYKRSNREPYTKDPYKAKRWKTRKNAERFLGLKDRMWASMCTIEEHEESL